MATGDVRNNLRRVEQKLKWLKCGNILDVEKILQGSSSHVLEITRVVLNASRNLLCLPSHLKDAKYYDELAKLLRNKFSFKLQLSKEQFFAPGFVERKLLFLFDFTSLLLSLKKETKKPTANKAFSQSLDLQSADAIYKKLQEKIVVEKHAIDDSFVSYSQPNQVPRPCTPPKINEYSFYNNSLYNDLLEFEKSIEKKASFSTNTNNDFDLSAIKNDENLEDLIIEDLNFEVSPELVTSKYDEPLGNINGSFKASQNTNIKNECKCIELKQEVENIRASIGKFEAERESLTMEILNLKNRVDTLELERKEYSKLCESKQGFEEDSNPNPSPVKVPEPRTTARKSFYPIDDEFSDTFIKKADRVADDRIRRIQQKLKTTKKLLSENLPIE